MMARDEQLELVRGVAEGRISRRDFVVRAFALGISTSTVASVLAACGGNDSQQGFSNKPQPTKAVAPTAAAGDAAAAATQVPQAKALKGRVVVSIIQNPDKPVQEALSKAYRQRQSDVEVAWEGTEGGTDEYTSWLGTKLAASKIEPDIVSGNYVPNFRGYVNLDKYRKTTNPYTGNPWDEDLDWDFNRRTNTQGERIVLSTRAVHINWFYNKELFEKSGVEPPKSWDEFEDVCAKLQQAGITPIASNWTYMVPEWFAQSYFDQYHVDWVETVRAKKGDWNYDPELDGKFKYDPNNPHLHNTYTFNVQRFFRALRDGDLRYDTPEMEELVKNMARIFPKYATKDLFVLDDPYAPFLQQQVAIMSNGSWAYGILKDDMESLSPERLNDLGIKQGRIKPFEWGTFENPPMEGDLVKSRVRTPESSTGEYAGVIQKDQPQTELALDFLQFWFSPAGYQTYVDAQVKSGSFAPAGPLEVNGVEDPPEYQELFEQIKVLGNAEIYYNRAWVFMGGGDIQADLFNLFKSALQGGITPKQYSRRLQDYVTKNFDAILKQVGLTKADIDNPARQLGT